MCVTPANCVTRCVAAWPVAGLQRWPCQSSSQGHICHQEIPIPDDNQHYAALAYLDQGPRVHAGWTLLQRVLPRALRGSAAQLFRAGQHGSVAYPERSVRRGDRPRRLGVFLRAIHSSGGHSVHTLPARAANVAGRWDECGALLQDQLPANACARRSSPHVRQTP